MPQARTSEGHSILVGEQLVVLHGREEGAVSGARSDNGPVRERHAGGTDGARIAANSKRPSHDAVTRWCDRPIAVVVAREWDASSCACRGTAMSGVRTQ